MTRPNSRAGGFFLIAAILGGAVLGISQGSPMKGILIGTVSGIVLAVAIWLVDRRR